MKIIAFLIIIFSCMYLLFGDTSQKASNVSKAIHNDISKWIANHEE